MGDANAVSEALTAACQGQLTVTALANRLTQLDAFRGLGRDNPIAKRSASVLDALPKLFVHGAGETVGSQLGEKLALHSLLLQLLNDAGAFPKLHASVLRCIFEDGQRLQALLELRELHSKLQEQAARSGAGAGEVPLHEVVLAAGRACMAAVAGSGERSAEEVFYALPTSTTTQFFQQVAAAADGVGRQPGLAAAEFEGVAQLAKAVQVTLGGALQQRSQQQQLFGPALNAAVAGLDEPEWTAGAEVRAALLALAEACCRLNPLLAAEAPQEVLSAILQLWELTDRLLNAGAAAVAAAPPGQQRLRLHSEYAAARERLLGQLLSQVLALGQQDEAEAQLRRIQGLAEAHSSYSQLFDIADATGGWPQLFVEMQQLRGDALNAPLAPYVFERLLKEGRHAELLDLPADFDSELQQFLSDEAAEDAALRRSLRWLHELRVGDYAAAADTLANNRQLESSDALLAEQEGGRGVQARAAALQKLAALAACPWWPLELSGHAAASVAQADAALEALQG